MPFSGYADSGYQDAGGEATGGVEATGVDLEGAVLADVLLASGGPLRFRNPWARGRGAFPRSFPSGAQFQGQRSAE